MFAEMAIGQIGTAAINAEANKQIAQINAQAKVDQAEIMGITSRENTKEQAMTLRFGIQQQSMIMYQQLVFADIADRRVAANERRALRNELQVATFQYNSMIHQQELGHKEAMAKIGLEAKQIETTAKNDDKMYQLEKMQLQLDHGMSPNDFLKYNA